MFKNLGLVHKIQLLVGGCAALMLAVIVAFSGNMLGNMALKDSFEQAEELAHRHGNTIRAEIETSLDTSRTLAYTLQGMKQVQGAKRSVIDSILQQILTREKNFLAVWTLWEPDALDDGPDILYSNAPGHDAAGRYLPYWNRENGRIQVEPIINYEYSDFYYVPQTVGKEVMTNPYKYPIAGKEVLMASVVTPVYYQGRFCGVAGVDYILDTFQEMIERIRPYDTGFAGLASSNGVYVAHADKRRVMDTIRDEGALAGTAGNCLNGQCYVQ